MAIEVNNNDLVVKSLSVVETINTFFNGNSNLWNEAYNTSTSFQNISESILETKFTNLINSTEDFVKITNNVVPLTSTLLSSTIPQAYYSVTTNDGKLYFAPGEFNDTYTITCFNNPKDNPNDITFIPVLSGDKCLGLVYDSARNLIYFSAQSTNLGKISGIYTLNPTTNTYTQLGNNAPAQHGVLAHDANYLYVRGGGVPDSITQLSKTNGTITNNIKLTSDGLQMLGPIYGSSVTPDNNFLVGVGIFVNTLTFAVYSINLLNYSVKIAPLTAFATPTGAIATANNFAFIGLASTGQNLIYDITTNTVSALPVNKNTARGNPVIVKENDVYYLDDTKNIIQYYNYQTKQQKYYTTNYIYNTLGFNNDGIWALTNTGTSSARLDNIKFETGITNSLLLSTDIPSNIQFKPIIITAPGSYPIDTPYVWYELSGGGNIDVSQRMAGTVGNSVGDILVVKNSSLTADVAVRRFGSIIQDGLIKPGEMRRWTYTGLGTTPVAFWKLESSPAIIGAVDSTTFRNVSGNWQSTYQTVQSLSATWNESQNIISVKDYGAIGDGIIDDTAAFTRAVTASPASVNIFRGDSSIPYPDVVRIFVPPGTYNLTSLVTTGGRKVIWELSQSARVLNYSNLNGKVLRAGERVTNSSPFGIRDNAVGMSVMSRTEDLEKGAEVTGITNKRDLGWYSDRDSVSFYAENVSNSLVADISNATYTLSAINPTTPLTTDQVKKLVKGMIIETKSTPKWTGLISSWSANGTTITTTGWIKFTGVRATTNKGAWTQLTPYFAGDYVTNNGLEYIAKQNYYSSTSITTDISNGYLDNITGTPGSGGARINPFSKLWAHNANVTLTNTGYASAATGFELGVLNNLAAPANATSSPVTWGYDCVNLGTYKGSVAFTSRGSFFRAYEATGADVTLFSIDAKDRDIVCIDSNAYETFVLDGNAGRIELGNTNIAGTRVIDFRNSGTPGNDYDCRIRAVSGTSTSTGQGYISLLAARVGIGTESPNQRLTVSGNVSATGTITTNNDIEITDPTKGYILPDPSGNRYRITILAGGVLSAVAI